MKRFYEGSGDVGPAEQAEVAYRELRRSLIKFAAVEAELHERAGKLTPMQETLLYGSLNGARDRIMVFAAVYHVERDRADRQISHT